MPVPQKGLPAPRSAEESRPTRAFYANNSGMRSPLPDELVGGDGLAPMGFYEEGKKAGEVAPGSTRVGFTLRNSSNRILDAFAFRINPQGLAYTLGSRATLAAVKSGMYIDDFGPGATAIVMRQLVASGKNAFLEGPYYTAREDVQRFLTRIYLPATAAGKAKKRVFFHDHHFERGFEQRVVFMPQSALISRDVNTPGIWNFELHMLSLEKYPFTDVEAEKVPTNAGSGKQYQVKRGDTLEKIVRKLAGKNATSLKRQITLIRLLELNPQLRKRRRIPGDGKNEKSGKPMRVYRGEILALP